MTKKEALKKIDELVKKRMIAEKEFNKAQDKAWKKYKKIERDTFEKQTEYEAVLNK